MMPGLKPSLLAAGLLGGMHGLIGVLPEPPFSLATNLVLYVTNLYVLFCAWLVLQDESRRGIGFFVLGYLLLFLLVLVWLERESLFILLIILYASVFRVPFLLGIFVILVLSYVVFQPYAFETFVPLTLAFLVVWKIYKSGASIFKIGCWVVGLGGLAMILLPCLHLVVQDSPQTLAFVFSRGDVRSALWVSLASSAVATLVVILWGVPLAYAMARSEFRGKGVVESLIDLPILIPHSVVGIALSVLLGPGSPLGGVLTDLGFPVAGRFAGIVVAQVFVSCPFLIKTAQTAFEGVPEHLEDVARTLGAGSVKTFFLVSVPLASRGILVGIILAWARAISELGAVLIFARSPRSAAILVHDEFVHGISESRPIAVLLLLICLWIFVLLQFGKTFLPIGIGKLGAARGRQ